MEILFFSFVYKRTIPNSNLKSITNKNIWQNLPNYQTKTAYKSNPLAPTHPSSSFLGETPPPVPFNVDNVIPENIATS